MAKEKPVLTLRSGKIKLSVWEQEKKTTDGRRYKQCSIKIVKTFQQDGQWKETDYFFSDELPVLSALCNEAFSRLCLRVERIEAE